MRQEEERRICAGKAAAYAEHVGISRRTVGDSFANPIHQSFFGGLLPQSAIFLFVTKNEDAVQRVNQEGEACCVQEYG